MAQLQSFDLSTQTATQLSRFPYRNKDRLAACAALSPRIAQLAFSHPVAFFALASGYGPPEAREDAIRSAVDGRLLSRVSQALGLPMCLRRLPPEVCRTRLPYAEWSVEASKQLAPYIPSDERVAQAWLAGTNFAARTGDEDIALWIARQHRLFAHGVIKPRTLAPLILFAWATRDGRSIRVPVAGWSRELEIGRAVGRAAVWLKHLKLAADMGPNGLAGSWLGSGKHAGLEFVALTTAQLLSEEAREMQNCIVEYGEGIARGICQLYGVRQGGRRIATIEVRPCSTTRRPVVVQAKGHHNFDCSLDLWHAATAWVDANAPAGGCPRARSTLGGGSVIGFMGDYSAGLPANERRWASGLTFDRLRDDLIEIGQMVGETPRWLRWT